MSGAQIVLKAQSFDGAPIDEAFALGTFTGEFGNEARKKVKGAQKKKEQAKKEEVEAEEAEEEAVKEEEDNSGESKAEVEFPLFQKHPFGFQDYLTTALGPTQAENKNKKKKKKEKVEAEAENKKEKGKTKVEDDGEGTEADDDK
ncbi:H/ACA ribonucleoprotein complex subunit 4-like [Pyrus communis]|uniref:H/ACA ribonucleoprotein complex subunit 4-like n=1 Tax=Pyrus communis TaxID=23211 RepID=UPI0035C0296E